MLDNDISVGKHGAGPFAAVSNDSSRKGKLEPANHGRFWIGCIAKKAITKQHPYVPTIDNLVVKRLKVGSFVVRWMKERVGRILEGVNELVWILVGTRWEVTDYPPIGKDPREFAYEGPFLWEDSLYRIVTAYTDKVGGHLGWIQFDSTPWDSRGNAMTYIGQMLEPPDFSFDDYGVAYIFFSEETGQTKAVFQSF